MKSFNIIFQKENLSKIRFWLSSILKFLVNPSYLRVEITISCSLFEKSSVKITFFFFEWFFHFFIHRVKMF